MQPFFIETIRLEDGVPQHLEYHQERMRATYRAHFHTGEAPDLRALLPTSCPIGCVKWRVVYGRELRESSVEPYAPRHIATLRLVIDDEIDYAYKRLDRTRLNLRYAQRGAADDVIIVRRGLLTDTSIANIALGDGKHWFTPAEPLLKGTARERLISEGLLTPSVLTPADLLRYPSVVLFNALISFGTVCLRTESVCTLGN